MLACPTICSSLFFSETIILELHVLVWLFSYFSHSTYLEGPSGLDVHFCVTVFWPTSGSVWWPDNRYYDIYDMYWQEWVSEYCFGSLSAHSWQYRDRRGPEACTMPPSYFKWLQGFLMVHYSIGSTVHSMSFNSAVYAQLWWQISGPTGIRTWYQVTSPSQYEWAIGAGRIDRRAFPTNIVQSPNVGFNVGPASQTLA